MKTKFLCVLTGVLVAVSITALQFSRLSYVVLPLSTTYPDTFGQSEKASEPK